MELSLKSEKHIITLDGIRGLAILLVLVAHFLKEAFLLKHFPILGPFIAKFSLLGLTGVSLFFILSGYLITNILFNAKNRENYFINFYARRTLRIFPLYYGTLIIVFTIFPLMINFSTQSLFLKSNQIWLWIYLSNFPNVAGIWNSSQQFSLGHLWSLSVEEHFYLIWPFIVYFADTKKLKIICIIIVILSIILGISSTLLVSYFIVFKYLSWTTITFSGALALGGLLACIKKDLGSLMGLKKISKKFILYFGILLLMVRFIPRRYGTDLLGIMTHEISWFFYVGIIIYVLNLETTSFFYKVITNKFFLIFGKLSYGIYMFHGILMPYFERHIDIELMAINTGSALLAILLYYIITIGIVFIIAWFSYVLFESQVLKLKKYFNN
jgi:peptidoglycan/LPS O-acetylase OafA/YrhL